MVPHSERMRSVVLALLGGYAVLISLASIGLIAAGIPQVQIGIPVSLALIILWFCYRQGYEWARQGSVLVMVLAVGLGLIEPFVTEQRSLAILIPSMLALAICGPAWIIGSALGTLTLLVARGGTTSIYLATEFLAIYVILIGSTLVSRLVIDAQRRMAEHYAEQAEYRAAALQEREAQLQALYHCSPVGVLVADTVGRIRSTNPRLNALLDLVAGMQPVHWLLQIHPEDRPRATEDWQRVVRQRCELLSQYRLLTQSGTVRWLQMRAAPIDAPDGRHLGIVATVEDISARVEAEQQLRESEERYRLITDNTGDFIFLLDPQGNFLYVSPSFERIIGYTLQDLEGKTGMHFTHPDDAIAARRSWSQLRVEGSTHATSRFQRRDGGWSWIETRANRVNHGSETYVICVSRDVTTQRALEAQMRQAQKMEAIGRLAGGIAHDFNNLLVAIGGYADLISSDLEVTHPAQLDLREIRRATERATALTRGLLAFARRQIVEPQLLQLNDLILDMDRLLRRLIGEHIEFQTLADHELWAIRADPSQIEQVIVNLVVNARDAMPDGGQLVIETANVLLDEEYASSHLQVTSGPYVMLAVSDTGIGMNEEVKAHLFEPFFTTKPHGEGTGLGLATCYGIVDQNGGAISVYSEVGRGTTIKVFLPRAEGMIERRTRIPEQVIRGGKETILVVEDETAVRALSVRVLRSLGYQVLEAANGEAALELVSAYVEHIDMLLTDVVMPGINGPKLAELISKSRPGMRVLFTSGYTETALNYHEQQLGAVAFMHKPFTPHGLAIRVRELLDTQNGTKYLEHQMC